MFKLRFHIDAIDEYAGKYDYPGEDHLINATVPAAKAQGYLRISQLLEFGNWKSPRIRHQLKSNSDEMVKETTRLSFQLPQEILRIEILRILSGVQYPMASVILHFCHRDPYPILDFRALWSLGVDKPPAYTANFWLAYTQFCRELSLKSNVDMRTLDRALWQYSKENQRRARSP